LNDSAFDHGVLYTEAGKKRVNFPSISNVIPKRSFLTEYSCRIDPGSYPKLMRIWFDAMKPLGLDRGHSFDLDFHTIPFHDEDALVEKHYVSKRSRRQKGILAFLAQDASNRVFCYANAQLRKKDQNDEILRFVDFWKERTGKNPEELIFDSKLTTYANLDRLRALEIDFITLRPRSVKLFSGCGRNLYSPRPDKLGDRDRGSGRAWVFEICRVYGIHPREQFSIG
jgi:hypothetical protein